MFEFVKLYVFFRLLNLGRVGSGRLWDPAPEAVADQTRASAAEERIGGENGDPELTRRTIHRGCQQRSRLCRSACRNEREIEEGGSFLTSTIPGAGKSLFVTDVFSPFVTRSWLWTSLTRTDATPLYVSPSERVQ